MWETGRLTMEPNVRYNSVKNADDQTEERVVASYNLAVTRSYNQQTADFFRCIAFGKNAQFVEKYLHKGTKISICGHLQSGNYTDKDGIRRYRDSYGKWKVSRLGIHFSRIPGTTGRSAEPKRTGTDDPKYAEKNGTKNANQHTR